MSDDPRAPVQQAPPWHLTGHGYLLALRCSRAFGEACLRDCPTFEGRALGGVGALMVIDYAESEVGPYRELLLSPGNFQIGSRRAAAITHIWVSTQASVDNGRANWGLPKNLAQFTVDRQDDGSEIFSIRRDGAAPLTLGFSAHGPALPVNTSILPKRWRTLEQPWHGQLYRTAIHARGRARLARLSHYENPSESGFPDIGAQAHLIGMAASSFALTFPVPRVEFLRSE